MNKLKEIKFIPKDYQKPLYINSNIYNKFICLWHRRAGKTITALSVLSEKANNVFGNYYYVTKSPEMFWRKIIISGDRYIDFINNKSKIYNSEMKIELINGSTIKFVSPEKYSNVSKQYSGAVYDEYCFYKVQQISEIITLLSDKKIWMLLISSSKTIDLQDLGNKVFINNLLNSNCFTQILTVGDTGKFFEFMDNAINTMSKEFIETEFYCNKNVLTNSLIGLTNLKKEPIEFIPIKL